MAHLKLLGTEIFTAAGTAFLILHTICPVHLNYKLRTHPSCIVLENDELSHCPIV